MDRRQLALGLVLFSLGLAASPVVRAVENGMRIVDAPYMAVLYGYVPVEGFKYLCGGVIVANDTIVTAKSCVPRDVITVRVGYGSASRPGMVTVTSGSFVKHPSANIALIKIPAIAEDSPAKPIALPDTPLPADAKGMIMGWGEGDSLQQDLMGGETSQVPNLQCALQRPLSPPFANEFCTLPRSASIAQPVPCLADYGTPFVFQQRVQGIVSHQVNSRCQDTRPPVYLRIYPYLDFIRDN